MKRTSPVKSHVRGGIVIPRHRRSTLTGMPKPRRPKSALPPAIALPDPNAVSPEDEALQAARGAMPQPGAQMPGMGG